MMQSKKFQTDHGLVADGWVGPITRAALLKKWLFLLWMNINETFYVALMNKYLFLKEFMMKL